MWWYIYMHIVILHWYQLVITYRVGYHVRFCDISAQQRGRKYYIFPTWYKNKKVITAFCPKPSTANFMQRNLLLFSRHLPCLLLRAITFYLNFEFTPTLWPFFARFAITSRHLWTIIIVDHGLYHGAYSLVARLEIQTWLNTNVNEYTKQSNAEKSLSVFFLIKVLLILCYDYPTMRQNYESGLFSHLSLFGKGRLEPTGS